MKIWRMVEPVATEYRRCYVSGSWDEGESCPSCSRMRRTRVPPLLVEYRDDAPLGDFLWPTWTVAAKRAFAEEINSALCLADTWPAKALVPVSPRKKKQPPSFEAIDYRELIPKRISVDLLLASGSTILIKGKCPTCGLLNVEIDGVEQIGTRFNSEIGARVVEHKNRLKAHGLRIRKSDLPAPVFGIMEAGQFFLATDEAKIWIHKRGANNVEFLEYGDLLT